MKHYGDICKIHGHEVEAVDVITGGSPCQDLSLAGKRAGLAGARSGLFMEQIRIIKELRDVSSNDNRRVVRFMVWENVYGAFSSNDGEDFRAVLEETVRIKDPDAVIPGPPKEGWPHAGVIVGDGYSLAWRGHDAQWWGVPQRRKRICLLADFDGDAAARILFESELWRTADDGNPYQAVADSPTERGCEIQPVGESVPRDIEQGREERQGVTADSQSGFGETGKCLNPWDVQSKHIQSEDGVAESLYSGECRYGGGEAYVLSLEPGAASRVGGHIYEGIAGTIRAEAGDNQMSVCYGISSYDSNSMKSPNPNSGIYETETTRTLDLNGGNPACNQGGTAIVQGVDAYNQSMTGDVSKTLNSAASDSDHVPCVLAVESHAQDARYNVGGINQTLSSNVAHDPANGGLVMEQRVYDPSRRHGYQEFGDVANTMQAQMGTGCGNVPIVTEPIVLESNQNHATAKADGICNTLPASMGMGGGYVPMITEPYTSTKASYHSRFTHDGKAETLVATDYKDPPTVWEGYVVRRLTPTECMRLQGYPDDWVDLGDWTDDQGKLHKDSDTPKYKAAGNSIALPFWQWLAERICREYDRPVRMASLFDGIGGFPLVFSRCGAIPMWCSEIEPFPDAVTKARFKDG